MATDDIRTVLSVIAIIVSFVSLFFTRLNWLQSNRPIVTAFVTERESGHTGATFNLVVANTGNRPAVHVHLNALESEIKRLLHPDAEPSRFEAIAHNFSPESEIPLLRNGEELSTSFGAFSTHEPNGKWLEYGSEIEITVSYADLEGRNFKSRLPLKVYAREGFGGSVWVTEKKA